MNPVSTPQPPRLLSTGMQDLKRVYNWSTHFSSDYFVNMGTTISCLRQSGNTPEHNYLFTISTVSGIMQCNCSFNNLVGTGSKSQLLGGELFTIIFNSSEVTGKNSLSDGTEHGE